MTNLKKMISLAFTILGVFLALTMPRPITLYKIVGVSMIIFGGLFSYWLYEVK